MNTNEKLHPRQRLSAERLRRHWSQLEVADQIGTTPGNVSRWERGLTSPGPYFRGKLCELFDKSTQELGLTWDESDDSLDHTIYASASMAASLWDMPPRSTPSFSGGQDLLAQLRSLLRPDTIDTQPSVLASSNPRRLNLPEQESSDQRGLMQAITQWLQTQPNWVLIVDNVRAVALVVPKEWVYGGGRALTSTPSITIRC